MNLYLSNYVVIEDFTQEVLDYCKKNLTFVNSDFIKREQLGKYTGGMSRYIELFQIVNGGRWLLIPFGKFAEVYRLFKMKIDKCVSLIQPKRAVNFKSYIQPYGYQETAITEVLCARNGVLVAPCGSGKTQMGLEIVARIGGRTLWLTHTIDLLRQSMARAKANFGIPNSEYGMITNGKINVGKSITFATVQTMANVNLDLLRNEFDCIVVDECHHCVGSPTAVRMFYKVMSSLRARYKIGLTATPFRSDGLHYQMYAIIGEKIYEVPKEAVKEKTCPVKVRFVETGYKPVEEFICAGDGTIIYSHLVSDICQNRKRNLVVSEAIKSCDGATLVLSERIEHLKCLQEITDGKKTVFISATDGSKASKEQRKDATTKLNNGDIDVLFATYALAKEGLDIPNLRNVVFASPVKDKTTVTQSAGRVERKADGKEFGKVIDFYDNFGVLKGYAKKRSGYYKKLGYEIQQ